MTEEVLSLSHVAAGYGGTPVLQDVSLSVKQGEILTLAGPNGCGKSTLLKTAARLLPCMPQTRNVPAITVEGLVLHGRFPYLGLSRRMGKKDREAVEEAMALAGILELRSRDLRELSGGERQKAYLAMVIAQDTQVVFLDEPTTYLDIGRQFEILELIRKLNRQGKTIVMVLHDLAHALTYSHRIAVMEKGSLLQVGEPQVLFESRVLDRVFGVTGHCAGGHYYFSP